jgi:N12 class adenine-specific DNA methylase
MENIRTRLQNRMKQRIQNLGERDNVVTFDELGADAFAVDELHEFKNLFYNTTMQRVPGMGNPKGSDKAFDLFVKLQWMFNTFGNDNAAAIGATGTPVSNSLVEMFNMQRLLQYPTLKANDLHIFDAWAKQFGSVESVYEVSPSGTGFRQSNRFSKFKNLPALMALYNSFADTVTLDDLKAQEIARGIFPVPKIVGGRPQNIVAKRSEQVADFMGTPELEMVGSQPVFQFDPLNGDTFAIVPQDNGSVSLGI